MRTHYKIIHDEDSLNGFINWLSELHMNQVYFFMLQSRKKYDKPDFPVGEKIVSRFYCVKEKILEKIRSLGAPLGSYPSKEGKPIPEESLTLYMKPIPRDLLKATKNSIPSMLELTLDRIPIDPVSHVLSKVQEAKGSSDYAHFDIDSMIPCKEDLVKSLNNTLGIGNCTVIVTRGGYHLLVNGKEAGKHHKLWHRELHSKYHMDNSGDLLTPVPGTLQGGYVPSFLLPKV